MAELIERLCRQCGPVTARVSHTKPTLPSLHSSDGDGTSHLDIESIRKPVGTGKNRKSTDNSRISTGIHPDRVATDAESRALSAPMGALHRPPLAVIEARNGAAGDWARKS